MKEPKYHWQYGLLSGYSPCCIIWFYIRLWTYVRTGLVYRSFFREINNKFALSEFKHVICPVHNALARIRTYKPIYWTCKECGWIQYGTSESCAIKDGHDTWVKERYDDYYKQIRYPLQSHIRYSGKIPAECRKKYGLPE